MYSKDTTMLLRFSSVRLSALLLAVALSAPLCAAAADKSDADDAAYTTDHVGLVPYWIGLGPIALSATDAAGAGLDTDLLGGEALIAPAAGADAKIGDRTLKWSNVTMRGGQAIVDGPQAGFGNAPDVAVYLMSYVTVDKDTPINLYWSCGDSGCCWLNGTVVGRHVGKRHCVADQEGGPVVLTAGQNRILIKILATGTAFGASARITDRDDKPIPGLVLSRAPAGKDAGGRDWKRVDTGQEDLAGPLGAYLVADQIGYDPKESKMAVATSRGNHIPASIEIRDAKSAAVVFTIPKDGGRIDDGGFQSTISQHVSRVIFDAFKTPGRYVLADPRTGVVSLPFDIKADTRTRVETALTRMFFYQRAGTDRDATHAGVWAGPSYHDLDLAQKATMHLWGGGRWADGVGPKEIDPTPHDVRGGWFDAGDPNLYTKNEAWAHNVLLVAYDVNRDANLRDDLNIPESGNKVPDIVDEARWTTDYLLKIQLPDGRVFDRTAYGSRYDIEKKTKLEPTVDLAEPCSGATLCAAGALAYAAAVWQEGGWDAAYAQKLRAAAELSWKYMDAHPSPWPVNADGKPRKIGSIDDGYGDEAALRATAAAALFRLTGSDAYKQVAEAWLKDFLSRAAKTDPATDHSVLELGYKSSNDLIAHLYLTAKGADPTIVADYGKITAVQAHLCRDQVAPDARVYEYGAGLPIYHWGATAGIAGRAAWMLWWAKTFAPKSELPGFAQAAAEYQHFLMGRNPTRWTLATSLQDYGATRTPQTMFHFSVISQTPDIAEHFLAPDAGNPDHIGVMPGYLLGGPSRNVLDFNPKGDHQPLDYERMEPSIMYQCQAVLLATTLAHAAGSW